jgi:hypothetical protein
MRTLFSNGLSLDGRAPTRCGLRIASSPRVSARPEASGFDTSTLAQERQHATKTWSNRTRLSKVLPFVTKNTTRDERQSKKSQVRKAKPNPESCERKARAILKPAHRKSPLVVPSAGLGACFFQRWEFPEFPALPKKGTRRAFWGRNGERDSSGTARGAPTHVPYPSDLGTQKSSQLSGGVSLMSGRVTFLRT